MRACTKGKNNGNYKHGITLIEKRCVDCNKILTTRDYIPKRCRSCARKHVLKEDITKCPLYKGGYSQTLGNDGYWRVYLDGLYMKRSRYIMMCELGRVLETWEEVHHKDENRENDDINNLQLMAKSKHMSLHRGGTLAHPMLSQHQRFKEFSV